MTWADVIAFFAWTAMIAWCFFVGGYNVGVVDTEKRWSDATADREKYDWATLTLKEIHERERERTTNQN